MTFLQTRRLSQKRFLDAYRLKVFNSVSKKIQPHYKVTRLIRYQIDIFQ